MHSPSARADTIAPLAQAAMYRHVPRAHMALTTFIPTLHSAVRVLEATTATRMVLWISTARLLASVLLDTTASLALTWPAPTASPTKALAALALLASTAHSALPPPPHVQWAHTILPSVASLSLPASAARLDRTVPPLASLLSRVLVRQATTAIPAPSPQLLRAACMAMSARQATTAPAAPPRHILVPAARTVPTPS